MWSTTALGADRADDRQRRRHERHDPARGDHVVEVGDVVAVQVGEQHGRQVRCAETQRGEAHQHTAAGVDEVVLVARAEISVAGRLGRRSASGCRCRAA